MHSEWKLHTDGKARRRWWMVAGMGGVGGQMHPPNHPMAAYRIEERTYRDRTIRVYGLDALPLDAPGPVRDAAARKMSTWVPLPINGVACFYWIGYVLGEFGRPFMANLCAYRVDAVVGSPGVAWIRGFYPGFSPEHEHWQAAFVKGVPTAAFAEAWRSYVARGASHVE